VLGQAGGQGESDESDESDELLLIKVNPGLNPKRLLIVRVPLKSI